MFSAAYFIYDLYMYYLFFSKLFEDNNVYVPKSNRWNRINYTWSLLLRYIQHLFDYVYDETMHMKVHKKYRKIFKSNRSNTPRSEQGKRHVVVNELRTKRKWNSSLCTVLFDSDLKTIDVAHAYRMTSMIS